MSIRRRACLAGAAAALVAPATAVASVQQVLLPGPTPYPTQSPPLPVGGTSQSTLALTVHARVAERVVAGVGPDGRLVSLRVIHRLLLTGRGDYVIVLGAPAEDVRAGAGSRSEPGLRTGQILWAGFAPGRKLLVADAELRPAEAARFLPLRLHVRRDGGRYSLTVANATVVPEDVFEGEGFAGQIATLLDRTRSQSLAGTRLASAIVSIRGAVGRRARPLLIAAPLEVQGVLRFPRAPVAASGATLHGRTVSFSTVLGDAGPLARRVVVQGGGTPRLRLVARPARLVRALAPPGASTWAAAEGRHSIPASLLLRRLVAARMQLVRADQYQAFVANPDPSGRSRTVYVYESSAAPAPKAVPAESGSGGSGGLVLAAALVGTVLALGAALVLWAHS